MKQRYKQNLRAMGAIGAILFGFGKYKQEKGGNSRIQIKCFFKFLCIFFNNELIHFFT